MGMAASQARYLGLTARKTNVEYEGQQINQARTALANQSANLFNRLLGLSVPTAPNTTNFTTQQYSFSDGYNDYEIDNIKTVNYTDEDGTKYNCQVTYHYIQDVFKSIQEKNTNPQVQKIIEYEPHTGVQAGVKSTKNEDDSYTISNGAASLTLTKCDDTDAEALARLGLSADTTYKTTIDDVTGYATFADLEDIKNVAGELPYYYETSTYAYNVGNDEAVPYDSTDLEQKAAVEQILHDYPKLSEEDIWVYEKNGKICYATENDFEKCISSGKTNEAKDKYQISSTMDYQSPLNQYYVASFQENITNKEYAIMDDASGSSRYSTIQLQNSSGVFQLNSETKTDEKSYEDAMQQYNYKVMKYQKEIEDINAKTSKLQEEDRTLELRLRQLDTEQKALSTEMDAVKGVIQKNIESTFKTFSS